MTLQAVSAELGNGGSGLSDVMGPALRELQGLNVSVVDGAAAGTAMAIAAIRDEDTILSAVVLADTWAAPVDDKANVTIQSCKATGTITCSVGLPTADQTLTVNSVVYTFKAAPTLLTHVGIKASFALQGDAIAAAINAYENRYDGSKTVSPTVVASSNGSGVVTVTAVAEGTGGNAFTLADTATNVAVSGATLSGGTATGSIKSTTDLSAATLLVHWFNKR